MGRSAVFDLSWTHYVILGGARGDRGSLVGARRCGAPWGSGGLCFVRAPGLRDLLAMNLRRLCDREPSISAVCRKLGINRQQFNNYLSARNLPNETVVAQICAHFEVEPYELFLPESHACRDRDWNSPLHRFADEIIRSNGSSGALPDVGSYFVYFDAPFDPTSLVRSYMEVRGENNILTFVRITRLPVNASTQRTQWNRHEGIIHGEGTNAYWSGYDINAEARPSLLVGHSLRTPPVLYAGVGLVETGNSTEQVGFAVTRAPARSVSVIRSLGLVKAAETPATRVAVRAIKNYRGTFSLSRSASAQ